MWAEKGGGNYQAGNIRREKIWNGRDIQHGRGKVGGDGKIFLAGYIFRRGMGMAPSIQSYLDWPFRDTVILEAGWKFEGKKWMQGLIGVNTNFLDGALTLKKEFKVVNTMAIRLTDSWAYYRSPHKKPGDLPVDHNERCFRTLARASTVCRSLLGVEINLVTSSSGGFYPG